MEQSHLSLRLIARLPSVFLPIAMSLLGLTTIAVGPLIFRDFHSADEGPTAHIWQMLMAGQVPIVVFFVLKWLRQAPRRGLGVLGLQVAAVLANFAMVYALGLG